MIKLKAYTEKERPDLKLWNKHQGRIRHHAPAQCWDDLSPANRELFLQAADIIHKGKAWEDPEIYAFGSRVDGNWVEHSDLDIMVKAAGFDRIRKLFLPCGIRVDCFVFHHLPSLIKIP